MPLLHCVGSASTNQTFSAAFCFLSGETQADYLWALSQIRDIYQPNNIPSTIVTDCEIALMNAIDVTFPEANALLCQWHIEKNLVSNLKRHFSSHEEFQHLLLDWKTLVSSKNHNEFQIQWEKMTMEYTSNGETIRYIEETWLPYKHRIILAYTKDIMHFNHLVTSRVESKHASVKGWISVSTGDLKDVYDKIILAINHQERQIRQQISYESTHHLISHSHDIWRNVNRTISHYALRKVFNQFQKAKNCASPLIPCSNIFSNTMGLPCVHVFKTLIDTNQQLTKEHFHTHWWLTSSYVEIAHITGVQFDTILNQMGQRYIQMPPHQQRLLHLHIEQLSQEGTISVIQNPESVRVRGRPQGSTAGYTTTTRDPSRHEYVEAPHRGITCSICNLQGHNCRTCPQRNDD